jgi:hypothetical protein
VNTRRPAVDGDFHPVDELIPKNRSQGQGVDRLDPGHVQVDALLPKAPAFQLSRLDGLNGLNDRAKRLSLGECGREPAKLIVEPCEAILKFVATLVRVFAPPTVTPARPSAAAGTIARHRRERQGRPEVGAGGPGSLPSGSAHRPGRPRPVVGAIARGSGGGCRDATDSFRVIVPREAAVGERCELMHEVNLLDIELDLGDVRPTDEVVEYLKTLPGRW